MILLFLAGGGVGLDKSGNSLLYVGPLLARGRSDPDRIQMARCHVASKRGKWSLGPRRDKQRPYKGLSAGDGSASGRKSRSIKFRLPDPHCKGTGA